MSGMGGGKYQLKKGRHYKASFSLSGMEVFAGNDTVEKMLSDAGFENVTVTGGGGVRYAEGDWNKDDLLADLPEQVFEIIEA